jgi:hypothetical protein
MVNLSLTTIETHLKNIPTDILKCDGHQPCQACLKRGAMCVYDTVCSSTTHENSTHEPNNMTEKRSWQLLSSTPESSISPSDKRIVNDDYNTNPGVKLDHPISFPHTFPHIQYSPPNPQMPFQTAPGILNSFGSPLLNQGMYGPGPPLLSIQTPGFNPSSQMQLPTQESASRQSASFKDIENDKEEKEEKEGKEEVVSVPPVYRMIEDPNGRQSKRVPFRTLKYSFMMH